jgi:anti-anti-sigma factor
LKFRKTKKSDKFSVTKARNKTLALENNLPKHIIIDCSMFSYIDTSGVNALKNIVKRFRDIGIKAVLSGCQVHIEKMLEIDGFFAELTSDHVYKTIHDAVIFCKQSNPKAEVYECHV